MSFRAIFSRFDNFMAMFVAMFAVVWSSVFMPLLGGPLHTYEARAIGAGWQSLQTGEAANITEAFQIATAFPAEAVFPSAHAAEMPLRAVAVQPEPAPLELLGGPDVELPRFVASESRVAPRLATARSRPASAVSVVPVSMVAEPICDIAAVKLGLCDDAPQRAGEPLAAGA